MKLPFNNIIRAEYRIPNQMAEHLDRSDQLVEVRNRELAIRIADEIIKSKPDIIEITISHHPILDYYGARAEVFVFSRNELEDLIKQIQTVTSEQITLVDNWKNKDHDDSQRPY